MVFDRLDENAEALQRILSEISFLGGFDGSELRMVLGFMQAVRCEANEQIISKGDEPSHIFIIREGTVELRLADEERELMKRQFSVGDHFGEVAMLTLRNESASFVALEACEMIAFPRSAFYRLKSEHPEIFCRIVINIARDLARKVQFSDDLMLRG